MSRLSNSNAKQSFFIVVNDNNTKKVKKVVVPSSLQIGSLLSPSFLNLLGGLSLHTVSYSITSPRLDTINLKNEECFVVIDATVPTSSGFVNVNLPVNPTSGQIHIIKDSSGTAATTSIKIISLKENVTIEGSDNLVLDLAYEYVILGFVSNKWHILSSKTLQSSSSSGGPPISASYLTVGFDSDLTHERRLVGTSGQITAVDSGANNDFTLGLADAGPGASSYTFADITIDVKGRVVSASSNSIAPTNAQYLTLSSSINLSNERILSVSTGLIGVDNGANNNFSLSINDNEIATLSGSNFNGDIIASAGLTGSLQNISDGSSYLVAAGNIDIITQSNGQILISSSNSQTNALSTPVFSIQSVAGVNTTTVAIENSKSVIGALYYNPDLIQSFSGTPAFWWRPIVRTSEAPVGAAVDLYDVNGIINGIPGMISSSVLSSSNLTPSLLQVNLTSELSGVTGSGIFETRLWKSLSGSITSSVSCYNAKLDIEFS